MNTQNCLHAASIPKKTKYRDALCFEIFQNMDADEKIFGLEKDDFVHNLKYN